MTAELELSKQDEALLRGEEDQVLQFAMEMVIRAGAALGAEELIDVTFAHIDSCHYYGQAHVDFARFVVDGGAKVKVPSWTNTVPVSVRGNEIRPPDKSPEYLAGARELLPLYQKMGCRPVWTCAPYQIPGGPGLGDHIIGSESNAVTYYNSVTGARTNKYGDFLDVCASLTGRAPYAGLHKTENRRGAMLFEFADDVPQSLRGQDIFPHVAGYLVGRRAGSTIPVVSGLAEGTNADGLKAFSAAAAASGGVEMFHAVGLTPEAETLEVAFQGDEPAEPVTITLADMQHARSELSPTHSGSVNMVALGTPHFSFTEFAALMNLAEGRPIAAGVTAYVSTSRHVKALIDEKGWALELERLGWRVIVDTCTYFGPPVRGCKGVVMTNSAKWAYYGPGMLDVEVAFGSLEDCVETAIAGEVKCTSTLWGGG
ncbi:MAG: aconitase X [Hyphomicrobiales bacterium]